MKTKIILLFLATFSAIASQAEVFRVGELTDQVWEQYDRGEIKELVIEFKKDDWLPVNTLVEGDFLESQTNEPNQLLVKRNFFVKMNEKSVLLSLDGLTYKPIQDMVRGSLQVGTSSGRRGGAANALNVTLRAFIK